MESHLKSNPHQDLKEWKLMDERLAKFKTSQWERNFNFNPLIAAVFTCLIGAMLAIALLFLTSIVVK